jgi:hypothetical protein
MPIKVFLIAGLFFIAINVFSQKNITGLINAEKAFAKYALDSNTRDAFVKFLDTGNVALNQGKVFNGYQTWVKREKRPAKLIWEPEFAVIAGSNEYGLITGPYEFKLSLNDTAIGKGNFTSIWHYNSNGEWKNILDHGMGYTAKREPVTTIKSIELKENKNQTANNDSVIIENNFIAAFNAIGKSAYSSFASKEIWFNTQGHLPVNGINNLSVALKAIADGIEFTPLGSGISAGKDFIYVYGATKLNDKPGNYVRVWVKENDSWKLILQVLN